MKQFISQNNQYILGKLIQILGHKVLILLLTTVFYLHDKSISVLCGISISVYYYDIRSTLSFDPLPTHSEACSDLNVVGQCYVIILNELCQPQKGKYHIFLSLMDPRLYKYIKLCMHRWRESKSQHILEERSGLMGEEGRESGRQQGTKELCPNYILNLLENGLRYPA